MSKIVNDRLEEIKKNGYALDFGSVFNLAFENYKKIALYGGLVFFVFTVLTFILGAVVLFSVFDSETILENLKQDRFKPENFIVNNRLIFAGVSLLLTCLLTPFFTGLLKMAYCAERDEEFHLSSMFEFYKAPYFTELFIATFVVTLLSSGIAEALNYAEIPLLGAILSTVVGLFTILVIPLIIFGKLKALDAIQASILVVSKQPFVLLGLLVVGYVATLVGLIGCCIGVFFTMPFIYSIYFAIYNDIIGFEPIDEGSN